MMDWHYKKREKPADPDYAMKYIYIYVLSIYVPSTNAYSHVLRLSLDLPYEKR